MLITLKPIAPPDLGEIVIDDYLFAVGRHEAPFSSYDPVLTEKMSRRHARIFEQDGIIYLVDLGSLNGTTVSGRRVGKEPQRLQRGDEICFAGLCFQAELLDATASYSDKSAINPPTRLILWSENPQLSLEPIVITEFPFLINKESDVFARYQEQLPKDVSYISRRHAHIFLRNNQLYIEDLGSTNGTYVDGMRLEEHARLLSSGNRVAFGGDTFSYRVEVVYETEEQTGVVANDEQSTQFLRAGNDLTKTTFVTSANSFLEIFCCEDEDAKAEAQAPDPVAAVSEKKPVADTLPVRGWRGLFRRFVNSLREIRTLLAEDQQAHAGLRSRRLWLAFATVVVVIAGGLYLRATPDRDIKNLLNREAYWEAAVQANQYLSSHPSDRDIGALATEALLKATLPEWMGLISAGRFSDAGRVIEHSRSLGDSNPEGRTLFGLMEWMTALESFIVERGGADAPVVMFAQEARINALLDAWEPDATENRHRLESMTRYVPTFSALRAQVFSHLRTLHSLKALDLMAIERLVATVTDTLGNGDPNTLQAALSDFESHYPRIGGIEKLRNDLNKYLAIDTARKSENWIQAFRLAQDNIFETPPFRERISVLLELELPKPEFIAQYDSAMDAWRQGQLDSAFATLEELVAQPWGDVAQRQLERNRRIKQNYADLLAAKTSANYEDKLLEFYNELDPVQDKYFADALAEDIRQRSETALSKAEQAYIFARKDWEKYRNSGGIRGLQRLEPKVSERYRQLATILSEAYKHMRHGVKVYKLLNKQCPPEWDDLNAQIENEVMLQRRSLGELAMVLEPALNKAKLDLLPVPPESEPAQVDSIESIEVPNAIFR